MTQQLVKWFIKNYEQVDNPQVRTKYGILASVVGVICNLFLFGMKLTIGIFIHSISVMADAFNNLSDAASCVISFIGVKLANRPADKEHPFGHGRYEYIAALIVSFLILQVGLGCFKSSIEKIMNPSAVSASPALMVILSLSVFVKVWMGLFNRTLGMRIHSAVLKASSADAFGDVLITSATIFSLLLSKLSGWNVDGYMGVIVSVFVLIAGFNIAKDTVEPLLGEAATQEDYDKITKFVESYDGIIGSHDLIVHNYGPSKTMASIHGEVPRDVNIEAAHEVIDQIERDAQRELGIFLIIHMDPIAVDDEENTKIKDRVNQIVKELEPDASIHDFRMVNGEKQTNLIFDLLLPHSYQKEKEHSLMQAIMEQVSQMEEKYQCIITAEHGFVAHEKKERGKTESL